MFQGTIWFGPQILRHSHTVDAAEISGLHQLVWRISPEMFEPLHPWKFTWNLKKSTLEKEHCLNQTWTKPPLLGVSKICFYRWAYSRFQKVTGPKLGLFSKKNHKMPSLADPNKWYRGIFRYMSRKSRFPKNPWTLQWKGERTCIAGVRVLKIASFDGSGFFGLVKIWVK